MRSIVVTGAVLCVVSLIADPLWFINYPKMLFNCLVIWILYLEGTSYGFLARVPKVNPQGVSD